MKTLEKQLPGLAVNYSKDGKMADAKPGASEMMRSGEDAANTKSDEPDEK